MTTIIIDAIRACSLFTSFYCSLNTRLQCLKNSDNQSVTTNYFRFFFDRPIFSIDRSRFSFSAPTLLVGRRDGHLACKNSWVCWSVGGRRFDWSFGCLLQLQLSPLTTSITLSSSNMQNRDILAPANVTDFLSFTVVELIRFFHRALHLF